MWKRLFLDFIDFSDGVVSAWMLLSIFVHSFTLPPLFLLCIHNIISYAGIIKIYFHLIINTSDHSLYLLKNYYHISSCSSVKIGITILNFTTNWPIFPFDLFSIPFPSKVIFVSFVVASVLYILILSPFKWRNCFLKPNIDSSNVSSIVLTKLWPYLFHYCVGISTISISKSDGAPTTGSSPKFLTSILFPSIPPFGIVISTCYILLMIRAPPHFGHVLVDYFPHPKHDGQVFSRTTFCPQLLTIYLILKPFPPHLVQDFKNLGLSAAVPLHWSHATSFK